MIEFIIPLNLPIRAVAVTEAFAQPPESLRGEIDRFKRRPFEISRQMYGFSKGSAQEEEVADASSRDIDRELEELRRQQDLFRRAIEELKHASTVYEQRFDGIVHEFQVATVELAEAISAKLIFEELNADRFPIANLIHEVIGRLDTTASTVVRLHPDDLAQLQSLPTIQEADRERKLQFVADTTLARGDCKAKAGEVSVIYELRRHIDEIRRQLLSTVDGHAET